MLALSLSTSAAASAAPKLRTQAERQEQYARAHAAMKKGEWSWARGLLLELWAVAPTYDVASSLATVEQRLGHLAASANHLIEAIARAPLREVSEVKTFRAALAELRPKIGALTVLSNRAGAQIFVDGEPFGAAPLDREIYVEPGEHWVDAHLGERSVRVRVEVAAGEARAVELEIEEPRAATRLEPEPARSSALSEPARQPSPSGLDRAPARQRNWIPVAVSGGLAAAAFGTGLVFLAARSSAKSDADAARESARNEFGRLNPCTPVNAGSRSCTELRESLDDFENATTVTNISFALGGVFTAGAVAAFWFWPRHPPEAARPSSPFAPRVTSRVAPRVTPPVMSRVTVLAGPAAASLLVHGEF